MSPGETARTASRPPIARLRTAVRRAVNLFRPRAAILLYHRVAELPRDPQLLAVSRKHFAEQLAVVKELSHPIRLGDLDRALAFRGDGKPFMVVTFDDGYADNLYDAKPLLEQHDVPATVFVSSGYVKSQREFLHDELDRIFLEPGRLPQTLQLTVGRQTYRWNLGSACNYPQSDYEHHRAWNVLSQETPSGRHRSYRSVFDVLFPLAAEQRRDCVCQLLDWSQLSPESRPTHRPLSEAEVIQLGDGGLVQIGGHTVNHPVLSCAAEDAQRKEIAECKAQLEAILGSPVTTFAYPYGSRVHYNGTTVAAVREAGFKQACSNFAGFVGRGADQWQLPRFLVRDWPGEIFRDRLTTWLRDL